jgi:hypothetical protein
MNKMNCVCDVCKSAKKMTVSESDLHKFVGSKKSNSNCNLMQFETDLKFHHVIHWDVGFADNVRYYIYRDTVGKLLAWYDTIQNCGFKVV